MRSSTALLQLCLLPIAIACSINLGVAGSGSVIEELRDVGAFDAIRVDGSVDVFLAQGEAAPVRVVAEDHLLPIVETTGSYSTKVGIDLYVTLPTLRSISTSGSSDVYGEGTLEADSLTIKTSGSSDAQVNAKILNARATGSSDIRYRGSPQKLNTSDSGSASIGPEGT